MSSSTWTKGSRDCPRWPPMYGKGFIFIHLDSPPAQSLKEFLGELGEGLAGYRFSDLMPSGSYRAEVNANWKVTLNSFQEGYHVPFLASSVGGSRLCRQ